MKKIMVIGCPGSGKSTFSRALHSITGIPLYHLDKMNWNPDGTTVDRSIFLEHLHSAIGHDTWILDGNYGSTMELRMQACDTVCFLDYPVEVCICGIQERVGKPREDMPWIETEADPAFLAFIKNYPSQGRPQVMALLNKYSDKDIHIFQTRPQADRFLVQLAKSLGVLKGDSYAAH